MSDEALIALAQVAGEPCILAHREEEYIIVDADRARYLVTGDLTTLTYRFDARMLLATHFRSAEAAFKVKRRLFGNDKQWEVRKRTRVIIFSEDELVAEPPKRRRA